MAVIITVEKTSAVEFDTEPPVPERRYQKTVLQMEPSPIQQINWMQSNSVFTFDHMLYGYKSCFKNHMLNCDTVLGAGNVLPWFCNIPLL